MQTVAERIIKCVNWTIPDAVACDLLALRGNRNFGLGKNFIIGAALCGGKPMIDREEGGALSSCLFAKK